MKWETPMAAQVIAVHGDIYGCFSSSGMALDLFTPK
jgi:hypothetical protein